jgi:hypothetical protein
MAAFVERGADVRVFFDEGAMQPGEGLAEKARDARVADIVLVLFSRNSLPSRWPRAQWEDALLTGPKAEGVRIGFVKCDDCIPPRVLAPLFDVSAFEPGVAAVSGLRRIKRWVRGHAPTPHSHASSGDLEVLGIAIADRPGVDRARGAVADEFVEAFGEDFDAVLRLPCASRSMAAITGDLAEQLGLRLEGDLESNVERIQEFCSNRRFLFVMEGGGPLEIEGRCSTLLVPAAAEEPAVDAESLRGVQRALSGLSGSWPELCRLARIGRRLTRETGRIAELYELMEQWHTAARERDDRAALDESAREMVWILEGWGRMAEAHRLEYSRAIECDEQLPLPFVELG